MAKREQVSFATLVKINDSAPFFVGKTGYVAYIGTDGVSIYLQDTDVDDCIPLKWAEFEVVDGRRGGGRE